MSSSKVLLVLGAGPRLGLSILKTFAANGYKTATVSRNPKPEIKELSDLALTADFSNPALMKPLFDKVTAKLGAPSVVVYNAAARYPAPEDGFSIPIPNFVEDTNVNAISPYAAIQNSIVAFRSLSTPDPKTFIYTGNGLTHFIRGADFTAAVGKRAAATLIEYASNFYKDEPFQFYYTDERKEDAKPVYGDVSGQNHADFYLELAEKNEQRSWEATFVGGLGYKDFKGEIGQEFRF